MDLSDAGYIEKPSLDDVVEAIVKINAGGIRGLIALGLVEKKEKKHKYYLAEIKETFSVFHDFLSQHLTEKEKEAMVFDRPMSEHFCCKISKLVRLAIIVFPDDDCFESCTCRL